MPAEIACKTDANCRCSGSDLLSETICRCSLIRCIMANMCPVCMEAMDEGAEALACGHVIHTTCLGEMMAALFTTKQSTPCPICKLSADNLAERARFAGAGPAQATQIYPPTPPNAQANTQPAPPSPLEIPVHVLSRMPVPTASDPTPGGSASSSSAFATAVTAAANARRGRPRRGNFPQKFAAPCVPAARRPLSACRSSRSLPAPSHLHP